MSTILPPLGNVKEQKQATSKSMSDTSPDQNPYMMAEEGSPPQKSNQTQNNKRTNNYSLNQITVFPPKKGKDHASTYKVRGKKLNE